MENRNQGKVKTPYLADMTTLLNEWGVPIKQSELRERFPEELNLRTEEDLEELLETRGITAFLLEKGEIELSFQSVVGRKKNQICLIFQQEEPIPLQFYPGDWVILNEKGFRKHKRGKGIGKATVEQFKEAKKIEAVQLGTENILTNTRILSASTRYKVGLLTYSLKRNVVRLATKEEIKKAKLQNLFTPTR